MKAKNNYSTKQDLKELENKLTGEMSKLRSDIVDMKDQMMSEFRKMREDHEIITGKHSMFDNTLDDHETRITKLESASTASI